MLKFKAKVVWKIVKLRRFIILHLCHSDIHTVAVELGQEAYPHDRAKEDTERVDRLTVMARVGVLSIIRKVRKHIEQFSFSLLEFDFRAWALIKTTFIQINVKTKILL